MADEMMDKDPASAQTGLAEAGIAPADVRAAHDMAAFVQECPSMFHTAAAVRRRLDEAGFAYLPESKPWEVRRGGRYYTVRNLSLIHISSPLMRGPAVDPPPVLFGTTADMSRSAWAYWHEHGEGSGFNEGGNYGNHARCAEGRRLWPCLLYTSRTA